jgi:general secretion pathway protein F
VTTFSFKAVGSDGRVRTGTLTGDTDRTVARELRKQGLTPVYVGIGRKRSFSLELPEFGRGRARDVLFFTQEMSTLLNSSVPLDRALSIVSELTEKPAFRTVVLDVLRILKGGKSLADSLAAYPKYFGDLFVNMVRAGEASGSLGIVFDRLADFEKSRDELRSFIISSMMYPGLLAAVGAGSIFVLLNFVVPRFAAVFEDSRIKVPALMAILLETSKLMQTWWWIALGGLALGAIAFRSYLRTPAGRLWWDASRLRIPVLGDALRKAETARFARAMATLVANSVPLVQAIGIAGAILNNRKMSGALEAVSQGVKRGEGIAAPLRRAAVFPALAGHLLSVGEETGKLDQMFSRMADIYEAETKAAIRRFTSLIEPVVILVMGLVVGGLVLSMLLAITSINEVGF